MDSQSITNYIKVLGTLNRATKNGFKAPHKPVLLLSILQSVAVGEIRENKIEITAELLARFRDNWNWMVKESFFSPNFSLPFYHLQSDRFWHLQTWPGKEILLTSSHSIKSFSQLKDAVAYAFVDEPLFALLLRQESRELLYHFLLQHYFNVTGITFKQPHLFEEVTEQILHEPVAVYRRLIEAADEEEIFIRSGVFKKVIPQAYNYTCCISGMHITSGYDIQMVDACHIKPFATSHDDTISNGISLSPNLHRAFDRGLVSIDNEYRLLVSTSFTEHSAEHSIKMFEGKRIQLPTNKNYYPSTENLSWHREWVFRN